MPTTTYYISDDFDYLGEDQRAYTVHMEDCDELPKNLKGFSKLGDFKTPEDAVLTAEQQFYTVKPCSICIFGKFEVE